jgi:hypothetical protein
MVRAINNNNNSKTLLFWLFSRSSSNPLINVIQHQRRAKTAPDVRAQLNLARALLHLELGREDVAASRLALVPGDALVALCAASPRLLSPQFDDDDPVGLELGAGAGSGGSCSSVLGLGGGSLATSASWTLSSIAEDVHDRGTLAALITRTRVDDDTLLPRIIAAIEGAAATDSTYATATATATAIAGSGNDGAGGRFIDSGGRHSPARGSAAAVGEPPAPRTATSAGAVLPSGLSLSISQQNGLGGVYPASAVHGLPLRLLRTLLPPGALLRFLLGHCAAVYGGGCGSPSAGPASCDPERVVALMGLLCAPLGPSVDAALDLASSDGGSVYEYPLWVDSALAEAPWARLCLTGDVPSSPITAPVAAVFVTALAVCASRADRGSAVLSGLASGLFGTGCAGAPAACVAALRHMCGDSLGCLVWLHGEDADPQQATSTTGGFPNAADDYARRSRQREVWLEHARRSSAGDQVRFVRAAAQRLAPRDLASLERIGADTMIPVLEDALRAAQAGVVIKSLRNTAAAAAATKGV